MFLDQQVSGIRVVRPECRGLAPVRVSCARLSLKVTLFALSAVTALPRLVTPASSQIPFLTTVFAFLAVSSVHVHATVPGSKQNAHSSGRCLRRNLKKGRRVRVAWMGGGGRVHCKERQEKRKIQENEVKSADAGKEDAKRELEIGLRGSRNLYSPLEQDPHGSHLPLFDGSSSPPHPTLTKPCWHPGHASHVPSDIPPHESLYSPAGHVLQVVHTSIDPFPHGRQKPASHAVRSTHSPTSLSLYLPGALTSYWASLAAVTGWQVPGFCPPHPLSHMPGPQSLHSTCSPGLVHLHPSL